MLEVDIVHCGRVSRDQLVDIARLSPQFTQTRVKLKLLSKISTSVPIVPSVTKCVYSSSCTSYECSLLNILLIQWLNPWARSKLQKYRAPFITSKAMHHWESLHWESGSPHSRNFPSFLGTKISIGTLWWSLAPRTFEDNLLTSFHWCGHTIWWGYFNRLI